MLGPKLEEFFDDSSRPEESEVRQMRVLCRDVLALLRTSARRIQDQVKQMADCVKGLSTPPQFTSCQVAKVVEQAQQTLHLLAQERGIALHREGLADLPPITADERRLYLAFYNLINNAIPEVPPGGSITVRGSREPGDRALLISVIDTGRGMPSDVQASLFTERTISRKSGGTGLGTKIVKDVVEAHGGRITVESKEGVGTSFHLRLPLRPPGSGMAEGARRPVRERAASRGT
jgi:signal transduction histidine kinase